MPRIISSTEFRRNLVKVRDALKRGKSFVLTYRERVIADIMPIAKMRRNERTREKK